MLITRQPRACRYMIFVNGQHEASDARRDGAFKEARRIRSFWKNVETVEVVDTWAWKDNRFSF